MAIAITSLLAVLFLCLYINKIQDYSTLQKDNQWLKEQQGRTPAKTDSEDANERALDKENAMEAIRYNGFVPESDGHWITFMSQGEHFAIDAERFPVLVLMKHYNLDHKEWDMDLMHKAAHQVSDDIIMGKVLFTGDEEDGIAFQIAAIENKYGHFKESLTRYINIIDESQARMSHIYNEMDQKQKEAVSIMPKLSTSASGEKKVMS